MAFHLSSQRKNSKTLKALNFVQFIKKHNFTPFSSDDRGLFYVPKKYKVDGWRGIRETQVSTEQLTLQSSQHSPWAQTASSVRVQVVALQHGFIHSCNTGKPLTTCGPDHPVGVNLSAGPTPIKTFRSGECTSCPGDSYFTYCDLWDTEVCLPRLMCSGFGNRLFSDGKKKVGNCGAEDKKI